jgi:hypothetical protein
MGILAQRIEQSAARLLQSDGYGPSGKSLGPLQGPSLNVFGRVPELSALPLRTAGHWQGPGMLAIRPIDGNESGIFRFFDGQWLGHLEQLLWSMELLLSGRAGSSLCEALIVESEARHDLSIRYG